MKYLLSGIGLALASLEVSAQAFKMDWQSISAGGTSKGGIFAVSASFGEPVAGTMSGSGYTLDSGFWSAPPSELMVNGSFENPDSTFVADAQGVMSLSTGLTTIPGWTTATAELAWVDNTNTFGAATPFGTFSLDLTGYHDGPPYGGLTQTISTVPGQSYRLSLSLGSNADFPGAGGQKVVAVCAGASCTNFTLIPTNTTGNLWGSFGFNFRAESTTTLVTIAGLVASGIYLGLDNVSVVQEFSAPPSAPHIISVEIFGKELHLSFTSATGLRYAIQSRTALDSGEWTTLTETTHPGTGGPVQTKVTDALVDRQRFYRVWQWP